MFAQLLITVALVVTIAELLCRLVMARSASSVVRELLSPLPRKAKTEASTAPPLSGDHAALRRRLRGRYGELAAARARLERSRRRDELADELARVDNELAQVESELEVLGRPAPGSESDAPAATAGDGKEVLDTV